MDRGLMARRQTEAALARAGFSRSDRQQMLAHLGENEASERLMRAVEKVTGAGVLTPDVGGTATTQEVTDAVAEAIYSSNF